MTDLVVLDDVLGVLPLVGPNAADNYTLFTLPVSETIVAGQIAYVNKLLPTLVTPTETNLDQMELWALNMACLRIVVMACGGMMLKNYDFKLGDLSMSKSGSRNFVYPLIDQFKAEERRLREILLVGDGVQSFTAGSGFGL